MAPKKHVKAPASNPIASTAPGDSQVDPAVIAYLRALDHPLKQALEALRQIILGVSSEIREGIKWNSPSFRMADYFATINVLGAGRLPNPTDPPSLRLIFHTGAKAKAAAKTGLKVTDPAGLLKWLAKDRCLVTFCDGADVEAKRAALEAIVWEWIQQL
jgi:hypothetical protein